MVKAEVVSSTDANVTLMFCALVENDLAEALLTARPSSKIAMDAVTACFARRMTTVHSLSSARRCLGLPPKGLERALQAPA
jgi:hypothetical protein